MLPKGTPIVTHTQKEIRAIEDKARERKALREYIIKERSNPFRAAASHGTGFIEDPAIIRFEAQNSFLSEYTYFKPTFRSVRLFLGVIIGPMVAIGIATEYYRNRFEAQCRRGEVSYAERKFKFV